MGAVGSHDTASAVVAVPMLIPHAAYICSGTWSLVGVELDQPVLTEQSRIANFTNERGVDGRIRYLRNVWHGATEGNFMCHLAMLAGTSDGDGTTWLEPVTDDQYKTANEH